jgi:Family of unknown function (DUF6527)
MKLKSPYKMSMFEFVEFIPEELAEGVLYISMKYKAARHRCACGCGTVIITPISPRHWNLKYDGKGVTLSPSIGNWNFDCQSHYWIVKNEIRWARKWSDDEIQELKPKKKA